MVMWAMGEAQVIAANGGQPTSRMGKSNPRTETSDCTAGLMVCTKKSKAMKIPANPAASFKADIKALPIFIPMIRERIRMMIGNITYALNWKNPLMIDCNTSIICSVSRIICTSSIIRVYHMIRNLFPSMVAFCQVIKDMCKFHALHGYMNPSACAWLPIIIMNLLNCIFV